MKTIEDLKLLDVSDLIFYLNSLSNFDTFRNFSAMYDDVHYSIPYEELKKYGIDRNVISIINDNTESYEGGIIITGNDEVLILGGA